MNDIRELLTPEALAKAGVVIKICPSAMPPWPPKPVKSYSQPRVARVRKDTPCKKLHQVRVGWTIDEIVQRIHVSRRDINYWISRKYLVLAGGDL